MSCINKLKALGIDVTYIDEETACILLGLTTIVPKSAPELKDLYTKEQLKEQKVKLDEIEKAVDQGKTQAKISSMVDDLIAKVLSDAE